MSKDIKRYISDNDDLLKEWDWEKNTISPYETSYGSSKICFWKCSVCGNAWQTVAYARGAQGCGCPNCAKIAGGLKKKKSSAQKNSFVINYPEIAKEWHPTRNIEYDINNVSSFSNIKVWWLCSECGYEWHTTVNHRTKEGTSCPACAKKQRANTKTKFHSTVNNFADNYPEIAKEWHPTKNGTLTPKNFSSKSGKKVWWQCSFCGQEWETTINHRTNGQNCPFCNKYQTSFPEQTIFYYISSVYPDAINRKKIDGFEFDIFIPSQNIAVEYDGTNYHNGNKAFLRDNKKDLFCKAEGIKLFRFRESILPDTDYATRINCNEKTIDEGIIHLLEIISNKKIDVDSQRDRNIIIQNVRQDMVKNSILVLKPELICEWNYSKNKNLLPESVAAHANYKVWWKCSVCGYEWQATPGHRFNGRGCPACAGHICITGYNDLSTHNPKVANEWNYGKNYPLTPENIAYKSNKKVWWKCSKGHEWQAAISERNRGHRSTNCPYCSNKKVLLGYNDLETTHPMLAKEWHPSKNGELKPTMLTAGSHKKVWWKCSVCGHEWEAVAYSRKNGNGCPGCYKKTKKV